MLPSIPPNSLYSESGAASVPSQRITFDALVGERLQRQSSPRPEREARRAMSTPGLDLTRAKLTRQ